MTDYSTIFRIIDSHNKNNIVGIIADNYKIHLELNNNIFTQPSKKIIFFITYHIFYPMTLVKIDTSYYTFFQNIDFIFLPIIFIKSILYKYSVFNILILNLLLPILINILFLSYWNIDSISTKKEFFIALKYNNKKFGFYFIGSIKIIIIIYIIFELVIGFNILT